MSARKLPPDRSIPDILNLKLPPLTKLALLVHALVPRGTTLDEEARLVGISTRHLRRILRPHIISSTNTLPDNSLSGKSHLVWRFRPFIPILPKRVYPKLPTE